MNNQTLQAISLVRMMNNACEHKRDNFVNIFVIRIQKKEIDQYEHKLSSCFV